MDFHGITMKGNYFMEEESSPAAAPGIADKRIIYNTSAIINGAADQFGGNRMYYHTDERWVRPLLGNINDGPDVNETRNLGSSTYRFYRIYAGNSDINAGFHGQVRYS